MIMSNEKLKGHAFIFVGSLLFAVNLPISKYLLPLYVTPEFLTLFRVVVVGVMFWIASLFVRREKVSLKDLGMLFLCSLCGIALNQLLFIRGLNITSPVDASVISTVVPVFVMLLAAFILREPITRQKAFGVLLGIVGALSLILRSAHATELAGSLDGNLLIIFSSLCYALYLVMSKPLTLRYSSVTIMKWMFLFATLLLLPFLHIHITDPGAIFSRQPTIDYKGIAALSYVILGATFLPYLLIPMAMRRILPTTVSMYNYVQPIVASFIAVWAGQDRFSIAKLLSAALVFVGVWLVTQSKSRADMEREASSHVTQKSRRD
ncbi:putative DMT superfamily transporter inner membrane protein [Bacteroidales bacterium Barb6]|nr:putative DMT superfamily transporter inner membrane protein [Bacteroidales bacterium Barb6]